MSAGQVRITAFGAAVDVLGAQELELPLAAPAPLSEIIVALEGRWPRLLAARGRIRYALNQAYATPDAVVQAGDEVAIIPPVSGGAGSGRASAAQLTRDVIDVAALSAEVADAGAGAIAMFLGVVRREHNDAGEELVALAYSAHEAMALAELNRAVDSAVTEHELIAARVAHRLGRLKIADVSIAIVVSAAHREAAFRGCRAIIEQIKEAAPIFKQEHWSGGAQNWVDGL